MIWYIWEIVINTVTVISFGYLLFKQLGVRTKPWQYASSLFFAICIISMVNILHIDLAVIVTQDFIIYPMRMLTTAIFVAIAFVFCDGNHSEKVLWEMMPMLIIAFADMVAIITISTISALPAAVIVQFGTHHFFTTLIHIVIVVISCFLLSRISKRKLLIPFGVQISLIVILLLGTMSIDILTDSIIAAFEEGGAALGLGHLMLAMTFTIIIATILVLVTKVGVLSHENMEYELEAQQVALERKSFDDIQRSTEHLREIRHDMKNSLLIMSSLINDKNYDGLNDYFRSLMDEQSQAADIALTEDKALNSLIYNKIVHMNASGITFHHKICPLANMPFKAYDMCSILGNLLDNAIEAAEQIEDAALRYASLTVRIQKTGMLLINVRNSYNGTLKYSAEGKLVTTKSGREHGLGLRHIERIIRSYDGYIVIEPHYSDFEVNVLLPYAKGGQL